MKCEEHKTCKTKENISNSETSGNRGNARKQANSMYVYVLSISSRLDTFRTFPELVKIITD